MNNRYDLDSTYFRKKLKMIIRDLSDYKPDELARELLRMSVTADISVINEPEFNKYHKG